MRIVCPECQAAYVVPDALIEPGKHVRCARCNAEWAPVPATAETAAVPLLRAPVRVESPPALSPPAETRADLPPEPRPALQVPPHGSLRVTSAPPARRAVPLPRPPARRTGATAAWVGWVLTVLVLAVLVWAAVTWRGTVMAGWPPSARVYGALGLGPPAAPAPAPAAKP